MCITKHFEPIYGKPCWNVVQGPGSSLVLNFGQPHLKISSTEVESDGTCKLQPVRSREVSVGGEWSLWIDQCNWILTLENAREVNNTGSREEIEQALQALNGQFLQNVLVGSTTRTSRFRFDLGAELIAYPYDNSQPDGKPEDLWYLTDADANLLIFRADGHYSYGPANTEQ